ncbi:ABC transporter ATP-binding protein [Vibrio sp. 10N.286.49.B3]|uniref:ABC transporter ATP-binding protein n=1 Tax=Vibrio sp. 10N.286.49.B3 TaxID=1880855 RepID=UPI000C8268E0|nr:ABC transporter ATP-binding protein [Vibrio sp. 10N.286.49.B3]PMH44485.1 ABC transporter ATP-binding protein [Vibrio sp. 10N.286.49.B3]
MTPLINIQQLSKHYGQHSALSNINLELYSGQILGLLGHNGAGKSTLINAILGSYPYQGTIDIDGLNPIKHHTAVMEKLAYISDVNVLPDWMSVKQLLKYTAGVHPGFNPTKAKETLSHTQVKLNSKIGALSKGMKVQLHLAIVIATNTQILILDEPTLGLDLLYRDAFYQHLLRWFHEGERALIIASHEVAEIEHLLTDVLILKQGQQVLQKSMDDIEQDYFILEAPKEHSDAIKAFQPLSHSQTLTSVKWLLATPYQTQAGSLGTIHKATLAEIFIALQKEGE